MKRNRFVIISVGFLLTCNPWLALESSTAVTLGSSPYDLTDESNYIDGCYDPCDCLLIVNPTLRGNFLLITISQDDHSALYKVMAVDWQYIQADETISVTGSGTYQVDSGQHRMILDLVVGDFPERRFDSGLVPVPFEYPGISIAVALNGFYCYDNVFDLKALPAPVEISHSAWGSVKSIFR